MVRIAHVLAKSWERITGLSVGWGPFQYVREKDDVTSCLADIVLYKPFACSNDLALSANDISRNRMTFFWSTND